MRLLVLALILLAVLGVIIVSSSQEETWKTKCVAQGGHIDSNRDGYWCITPDGRVLGTYH